MAVAVCVSIAATLAATPPPETLPNTLIATKGVKATQTDEDQSSDPGSQGEPSDVFPFIPVSDDPSPSPPPAVAMSPPGLPANPMIPPLLPFREVKEHEFFLIMGKAMLNVGVAEIFDKTWFVTLFLAMAANPIVVFFGSFSALALHTVIAAGLGLAISKIPGLHPAYLDFAAAGVLLLFALWYIYEAWDTRSDEDIIAEGKAGYEEHFNDDGSSKSGHSRHDKPTQGGGFSTDLWKICTVFLTVFLAEWGDRTQFVMIALNASAEPLPVVIGALLAFFVLVVSAVTVATVVRLLRLNKRVILICVAIAFIIFAALSIKEGVDSLDEDNINLARQNWKARVGRTHGWHDGQPGLALR